MSRTGHADLSPEDLGHLRRCVDLAAEAVGAGDQHRAEREVAGDGRVLAEDRNRETSAGDATRHPETAWRALATVAERWDIDTERS